MEKLKFPDVTLLPLRTSPLKGTPLIVVFATPAAPVLNAPKRDPVVSTSVSPEMFWGLPHVMEDACEVAIVRLRIVHANKVAKTRICIVVPSLVVVGLVIPRSIATFWNMSMQILISDLRSSNYLTTNFVVRIFRRRPSIDRHD